MRNDRKRDSRLSSSPGVFAQSIKPITVKPILWGNVVFQKGKPLVDSIESFIKHTTLHVLENKADYFVSLLYFSVHIYQGCQ